MNGVRGLRSALSRCQYPSTAAIIVKKLKIVSKRMRVEEGWGCGAQTGRRRSRDFIPDSISQTKCSLADWCDATTTNAISWSTSRNTVQCSKFTVHLMISLSQRQEYWICRKKLSFLFQRFLYQQLNLMSGIFHDNVPHVPVVVGCLERTAIHTHIHTILCLKQGCQTNFVKWVRPVQP